MGTLGRERAFITSSGRETGIVGCWYRDSSIYIPFEWTFVIRPFTAHDGCTGVAMDPSRSVFNERPSERLPKMTCSTVRMRTSGLLCLLHITKTACWEVLCIGFLQHPFQSTGIPSDLSKFEVLGPPVESIADCIRHLDVSYDLNSSLSSCSIWPMAGNTGFFDVKTTY